MPPSPAHTSRVRAEIFGHAGRLFRLRGYAGTNIDDIMLAAGLTRGAFYAHFKSKEELFAQVVGSGQGLLWKLRSADAELLAVLDAYLAKDRKSTRLNSSHLVISYAVFCLKKKKKIKKKITKKKLNKEQRKNINQTKHQ